MGHQQRAQLHSRTTPVSLVFALHKDAADFEAILPFLRRGIYEALRHAFCVYHMPLFSQLQIKESVTEHWHPGHNKGCPGLAQPTWQSTIHRNSVCFQSKINKPLSAFLYTLTPDPESDRRANVGERALSQTAANNCQPQFISNPSVFSFAE